MKLVDKLNSNRQVVQEVSEALRKNDGYCPCRIHRKADTKCKCKEFREQNVPGECHCGLFVKVAIEE